MLIQKPKGTYDLLPGKSFQRTFLESTLRNIFSSFNYREIRTPSFEKTSLIRRGIGEETDVVSKEMYSFSKDEFTLRPEMTAGVVRSYLEESLNNQAPLQKLFYIGNMFRRERPQAGRYREFSQYGIEAIGSQDYLLDVEIIQLAESILKEFKIKNYTLYINTIGNLNERKNYIEQLKNYLSKYFNELSDDSRRRFEKNPLRILDTKDRQDIEVLKDAPVMFEYLTDETKNYFEQILSSLKLLGINYEIDYRLVRGLDYYTHAVFEFKSEALGSQNTLIGGGRYDNLIELLGGKPTPAIGFSGGFERLMMILESNEFQYPQEDRLKLFIATMSEPAKNFSIKLVDQLRTLGLKCDTDFLNRSVKAQMKEANRMNAEFALVIGDEELKTNTAKLKKMSDSSEIEISDLNNLNKYLS